MFGLLRYSSLSLPDISLTAKNIYLRPPARQDADVWLALRAQNAQRLKKLEPRWPKDGLTRAFFKRRLARQIQDWNDDLGYPFLIFSKTDKKLLGGVNINHVCRGAAQYATLGYWLDKKAEGHGYMSRALHLIQNFSFGPLGLHRLNAAVLPGNTRSINLLKRAGFEEEGFAIQYIQIDGEWRDHILFGLPREKMEKKVELPEMTSTGQTKERF